VALPSFRAPADNPYGLSPPPGPPGPPRTAGLRTRQWAAVALAVAVGFLTMATVAVSALINVVNREPTQAEFRLAADAEVARRWRVWPSGRIFPERLSYLPNRSDLEYATRQGIAADQGCTGGLDARAATLVQTHGCLAVLRATYTDQLQGIAVTIGVVAFPDQQAAHRARQQFKPSPTALRAASFPGTAAARFADRSRQAGTVERGGPYLVLTASGQTDGRPASAVPERPDEEIFDIAPQLAHTIAANLSRRALPDCESGDWQC
jgi:hypothetical protein